ncbi:divalent-cation tolerance protein CutA [Halorarius litoreus]|uniref:divalent-cation tolerance protein CutA n=1 Tax=Halorarius litoreus TaxID=2962676 RepID=UPI0020CE036C|nr:divalent-cation tolerance protein CutA [Halorarius litoreus]
MPTAYITAPPEAAADLAERLVEEQLAACVNRLACESTYRWEGEVVHDDEVVLLAKTTAERYPDLEARVEELHPYEVPCIERFDEAAMLESFAGWRDESVR